MEYEVDKIACTNASSELALKQFADLIYRTALEHARERLFPENFPSDSTQDQVR